MLAFDDASLSIRGALIDYVHQFDFIKRVESGAKKMYQSPTVLPPIPYKVRFLEAMNCNFNSRHDQPRVDTPNEVGPPTPGKVQRSQSDIITTSSHETVANGIRPRSVSDAGSHAGPRTVSLVSIVE
ncbi:hypothetical protein AaE_016308 [Aphanomyces astaci]|uniref:PIPK domain-containing protein n=1 Tax=Aphanomyces astaci TaxID=112090 RepID=A0A6A4YWZ1_APHAT|nr:hypothetical protein AaE_016308 [Aphanomyces astaci]